ncbi:hypothetical protein F2Q69_00004193 [Brassica cretica]|uniref:CCHC-type domain-containing protein n=1 Tax=Brassica cretica TaxID=69181 RepID=A0A8S9P5R8_BRACR|nr:hypothetical protein F2Q69_00004193 [Brassica cretica]
MKVRQEVLKHGCATGTRKETDRCINNCARPRKKQHRMCCWSCGKVGHKKVECFAREKSRNMAKKNMDAALLGVIFKKIKKHQAWSQDTELSVTQRGRRSKCVRKWCEMIFRGEIVKSLQDNSNECRGHSVRMGKGSWSRRRHMTEAWSSTEAGRRVIRQVRNVVATWLLNQKSVVLNRHTKLKGGE